MFECIRLPIVRRAEQTHAAALFRVQKIHRATYKIPIDSDRIIDQTLPRGNFVDTIEKSPFRADMTEKTPMRESAEKCCDFIRSRYQRDLINHRKLLRRNHLKTALLKKLLEILLIDECHCRLQIFSARQKQFFCIKRSNATGDMFERKHKFARVIVFDAHRLIRNEHRAELRRLFEDHDAIFRQAEQIEELINPIFELLQRRSLQHDEDDAPPIVGIFDDIPHSRQALGNEMSEMTNQNAAEDHFIRKQLEFFRLDRIRFVDAIRAVLFSGWLIVVTRDKIPLFIANAAATVILILPFDPTCRQNDSVFDGADFEFSIRKKILRAMTPPMFKVRKIQPPLQFCFIH